MSEKVPAKIPAGSLLAAAVLAVVGAGAALYGLYADPSRMWPSLLLNGVYFTSLALSAMFFIATQRVTSARWSASILRIPEALMVGLPVASVLMLVLFLGRQTIFPWSHAGAFDHAPAIAGKVEYLRMPWVVARTIVALVLWTGFALVLRRTSLSQDRSPEKSVKMHQRSTRCAVLFVPVFALTFTLFAFDWLISLEPEWFSTMFAVYVFAGTFVQGIAAVTLATALLKKHSSQLGDAIERRHFHDLGKMLLAFTTFWAYIWVGQYLLIWYGNIPEEISHFMSRTNGPWLYLFAINMLANWVVPFVTLLPEGTKRSAKVLVAISSLLLIGHWLDLYLLIMPTFHTVPSLGVLEILVAVGYLSLFYLLFVRALTRAPMVPLNDPILAYEELSHSQAFIPHVSGAKQ